MRDIQSILAEASKVADELRLPYIQQKRLRKSIERIHIQVVGFPSSVNLRVRQLIKVAIESAASERSVELTDIIQGAEAVLTDEIKTQVGNYEDIRDHIIYEIITGDI
ncbi:hypothetical protein [Thiohalomonas denitrificans]|uniref:hypothetical protein n=1 Tax=Thiohalomonas denitrificans TaxID=415747 RepID=UPI0026E95023|nr:hypothetical protein [Thiohalomonas denitrificans]